MNIENTGLTQAAEEALKVHRHICECGAQAVTMIIEIGMSLKRMRDGKLYEALGYSTFKEYLENNGDYSFKERQAYTYIELVEKNSPDYLEAHADLGVTKLTLLSRLPGFEREEFIEEHSVAGLSAREIEELIKEHQGIGEQLSLLTKENEELDAEKESLESELAGALRQLREIESRPQEVAVRELTDDELRAIREKAEKDAKKAYAKEKKELVAAHKAELEKKTTALSARAEEAEKALAEAQDSAAALQRTVESEQAKRRELQDKLSAGSPDEIRTALKIYYEEAQKAVSTFIGSIVRLPESEQGNFYAAAVKWLTMQAERIAEMGGMKK